MSYTYAEDGNKTSYLIDTYTSRVGSTTTTYNYGYDPRGNITTIEKNGSEVIYTYDHLGQLTRETDGTTSRVYTYDDAGNITSIVSEPVDSGGGGIIRALKPLPLPETITKTLSYTDSQWGDLLTAYNGTAIEYDEIGNPLTYYNGSTYTFEWEGRRLVEATKAQGRVSVELDQ